MKPFAIKSINTLSQRETRERIAKLRKEIHKHRTQYHVHDRSTISEEALDSLKKELADLEQRFPKLITSDSPTQRVGGKPLAKFQKVQHQTRMLSLNDAFSRDDLIAWETRLRRLDHSMTWKYFTEPKIDGLAMSLIYEHGMLVRAATRGDGYVGEDVTQNLKTIESVLLRLEYIPKNAPQIIEVRGEVYLSKKEFGRINAERAKEGLVLYQNPRNTAAGSVRQLDSALVASRNLAFLAYALPTDCGQTTHAEEHEILKKMGFRTDPDVRSCRTIDDMMRFYETMQRKRDLLSYHIDGLVIIVNENNIFQRFGVVGKAPRGAVALKFPAEQVTTMVEDIQVQVGRTGALTPVAHLRPVQVAGTTVTRATLHNADEIQRLGVKIGDTVIVEKAGDIIPDIVRVLSNLRTGKERVFQMPHRCPVCDSVVVRRPSEVAHYCSNTACFAQQREQLYHFVSKKALNIDGLGPKIIDQLMDHKLITSAADIFRLREEGVLSLERFAEISAKKLVGNIQKARRVPFARFLYALGIRHVGEQTAIDLAEHFGTLSLLRRATQEDIEQLYDVGTVVAESITAYLHNPQHTKLLDDLLQYVTLEKPARPKSHKFAGKSFLFTGTLESMTRDAAKELVRKYDGNVASGVSKNLYAIVAGVNPGSKLAKAKKMGILIVLEKDFLELIK